MRQRLQNTLVAEGYVTTRVLTAPQDISGGTLTFTLFPGRVGEVRFAESTDARATAANALPIARGAILNLRDIEQALENFKRIPSVEADIRIVPAEGEDARPGVTASRSQYQQSVVGATQTYLYSGSSRNAEVSLSRLVYRDASRKTTLSASVWTRASRNYIDDTEVAVQRRRTAGWQLGVAHREFIGSGSLDLGLN